MGNHTLRIVIHGDHTLEDSYMGNQTQESIYAGRSDTGRYSYNTGNQTIEDTVTCVFRHWRIQLYR